MAPIKSWHTLESLCHHNKTVLIICQTEPRQPPKQSRLQWSDTKINLYNECIWEMLPGDFTAINPAILLINLRKVTFFPPHVSLCDWFCKRRSLNCNNFISWREKKTKKRKWNHFFSPHTNINDCALHLENSTYCTYCKLQMSWSTEFGRSWTGDQIFWKYKKSESCLVYLLNHLNWKMREHLKWRLHLVF